MTTTRTGSFLFLFALCLMAKSDGFSVVPASSVSPTARSTPCPSSSASPVANAMPFLRRRNNVGGMQHFGQSDASVESDALDPLDSKPEQNVAGDQDKSEKSSDKPKKGYQRVEDWDKEQKNGGMDWEQKVQFDGLAHGNGVKQNDILMQHL